MLDLQVPQSLYPSAGSLPTLHWAYPSADRSSCWPTLQDRSTGHLLQRSVHSLPKALGQSAHRDLAHGSLRKACQAADLSTHSGLHPQDGQLTLPFASGVPVKVEASSLHQPVSEMSKNHDNIDTHYSAQHANNAAWMGTFAGHSNQHNNGDHDAGFPCFQQQSYHRKQDRPASPIFQPTSQLTANIPSKTGNATNTIASYLQIPSTISTSKGSLAELAAQITCLLWFESSSTLAHMEDSSFFPPADINLVPEAFPTTGFLKWVTTILSTTQVTQNVIILALLFVYRLKKQNPTVKGKPGSEFRLLTVALMLANKFLDDNTYTNKTWAEVSGISVQEIHVMEVEFLSHMKYNLYTSAEDWHRWHQQLSTLCDYFDRASRKLLQPKPSASRPPALQIPPSLPSPPYSTNASPPFLSSSSPYHTPLSHQPVMPAYFPHLAPSPANSNLEFETRVNGRKRSYDDGCYVKQELPAKRPRAYSPYSFPGPQPPAIAQPGCLPSLPGLSIPNLPASTSQIVYGQGQAVARTPVSAQHPPPNMALPPFNWLHGVPSSSYSTSQPATAANSSLKLEMSSRLHTPTASSSNHGSPIGSNYSSGGGYTTPQNHRSPSHFLARRTSPYRPVRNINTLLIPQPSGFSQYPIPNISQEQMHWQPLGKPINERRAGRLPYLSQDAWPTSHQVDYWPPPLEI